MKVITIATITSICWIWGAVVQAQQDNKPAETIKNAEYIFEGKFID